MNTTLTAQELVSQQLRDLYQSYGYRPYKVSKFEEYDLYAQNKNFLSSKQILTFSDTNGHLMALKPDITLSIIQNTRDDHQTRKVWYTENVYRVPRNAYGFQEIMQTGLECIGQIDLYAMSEVLMLAVRSLQTISKNYVLDLSHMGILTGILADTDSALTAQLMTAIGEKNLHSLEALCRQGNVTAETQRLLMTLCHLSGPIAEAMPRLLALPLPEASRQAALELDSLCQLLALFGDSNVNLDLSVVNHTDYYNGLIFRGFVDGVASCVLSGGRYDHLLHRMGKSGGAVGFAVYFNELERFFRRPADYDVDTLLVYTPEDDPIQVAKLAQSIAQAGQTVRVQPAGQTDITYKRKLTPDGKEVQ